MKPAARQLTAAAESALCLVSISVSTTFFTFFQKPAGAIFCRAIGNELSAEAEGPSMWSASQCQHSFFISEKTFSESSDAPYGQRTALVEARKGVLCVSAPTVNSFFHFL
ncbi:hypothetical protein [Oleidesulfovibrio sp.]|uniref:hypothetical protein n=1 Tax=Oleidesulfovibrio sp. TaxID=2909707 RepID=UPI003A859315